MTIGCGVSKGRQAKLTKIKRTRRKRVFSALSRLSSLQYGSITASSARKIIQKMRSLAVGINLE